MELNYMKIPKAILYFILGVFVNIILYYAFSPDQVDMLGAFNSFNLFEIEAGTTAIIWGMIMIVGIIINIAYPLWVMFEVDDDGDK